MTTFTIVWKIVGGDIHEQDFRNYECEGDAVDDWMTYHDIDMSEIQRVDINGKQ